MKRSFQSQSCQKMARRKGFVLDALHRFWDVHHQQGIHRTAGGRQARTSHRFDAVQDLGESIGCAKDAHSDEKQGPFQTARAGKIKEILDTSDLLQ